MAGHKNKNNLNREIHEIHEKGKANEGCAVAGRIHGHDLRANA
jgi:hypothetical protein